MAGDGKGNYTELLKNIEEQLSAEKKEYEIKKQELDDNWSEAMNKVKELKASYKLKKLEYENRLSDMSTEVTKKEAKIRDFLQIVKDFVDDMDNIDDGKVEDVGVEEIEDDVQDESELVRDMGADIPNPDES